MSFQPLPHDPLEMRAALTEKLKHGSDRMRAHDTQIELMREEIQALKEANHLQDERMARIEENTATLVDIFRAGDGTLKTPDLGGKRCVWCVRTLVCHYQLAPQGRLTWPTEKQGLE